MLFTSITATVVTLAGEYNMKFDEYLKNIPKLHSWDGSVTWNTGGFGAYHLRHIYEFITDKLDRPRIIETGAGNSTLCFLFSTPEKLISIAPEQELFDRITAFCNEHHISKEGADFVLGSSQWVLPQLAWKARDQEDLFDFALIDGSHNWPMVFVDFFYINYMLKKDGYIMVDDVQLHSCKELARLLMEQPEFELELDLGKALIFRRVSDTYVFGDWATQPYIRRKTNDYKESENPCAL